MAEDWKLKSDALPFFRLAAEQSVEVASHRVVLRADLA
jgi:hypothetical protein